MNMVAKLWQALTIGEAMCVPRHPLCMLQNGDAGNEAIHSSCSLRKRNPDEELSRSIVQHAWIVWRRVNLKSKGSVQKAAQGGKISDRTQRNARTQSHVQTLLCKRWRNNRDPASINGSPSVCLPRATSLFSKTRTSRLRVHPRLEL